ncbi:Aldo-keto reductase [Mycena chlorophos]|uniref:Aldo-keto reductase n=1 Tax=Mycena chlorophos TaxID=658473 RepID=A0A8H6STH5_MYCCL|nr:Aldo-keto reductase [Mycena chlorophos]
MAAATPTTSTRRPYVALTPNQADFAFEQTVLSTQSESQLAFDNGQGDWVATGGVAGPAKGRWRWRALEDFWSRYEGLLLITASQATFSFVNVAVKMLQHLDEEPVSTLQLIVVRMAITYICSVVYMLVRKTPNPWIGPEGVRGLLVFRGLTGFVGLNGTYFSLQYLSLSNATVLGFLVPMCTAFAGSIFLKETFTRREAIAGLCSLFGVVLIARPQFIFGAHGDPSSEDDQHRILAIGIALLGVAGSTGAMTSIRAIGSRAHPMHLLAFFSLQSVFGASAVMAILHTPIVVPTRLAWLSLLGVIGVFGFLAQILLTMGFQREEAGRGAMAFYTQIIFASILERIFFKDTKPSMLSFLGTSIIIVSAVYVAVIKRRNAQSSGQLTATVAGTEQELEEGLLPLSPIVVKQSSSSRRLDTVEEVDSDLESEEDDGYLGSAASTEVVRLLPEADRP